MKKTVILLATLLAVGGTASADNFTAWDLAGNLASSPQEFADDCRKTENSKLQVERSRGWTEITCITPVDGEVFGMVLRVRKGFSYGLDILYPREDHAKTTTDITALLGYPNRNIHREPIGEVAGWTTTLHGRQIAVANVVVNGGGFLMVSYTKQAR